MLRSLLHQLDVAVIAAALFAAPLVLFFEPVTWRLTLIYGVVAPVVGLLFVRRHQRARFAVYIFMSMEVVRSLFAAHWWQLAVAISIVAYLQTPRMRRLYPRIRARQVLSRVGL